VRRDMALPQRMAAFVLMTVRLLIVFFRQTMTCMKRLSSSPPVRFSVAVALVACVTLPTQAGAQDRDDKDDKKSQGAGSRPPSAFTSGIIPICYGRANGEPRLVRPWNVANLLTPTCQPPAPWNAGGGWAAAACTVGGSFDCRRDEYYTELDTSVVGPAGPAGAQGAPGIAGPQGPRGLAGQSGATGPQGPAGPQGPIGPGGADGLVGPVGLLGPQGLPGVQGPKGDQGLVGVTGPQGLLGPIGPSGADGLQGPVGPAGPVGLQGPKGDQGLAGATGPQGASGSQGLQGVQGTNGAQGPAGADGPQGLQGPTGDRGPIGPTGDTGASGAAGPRGDGFTFRGAWDTATAYRVNDVATQDGSAYVARNDSVGLDPQLPGTAWALLAARGAIGAPGANGTNGTNGAPGTNGTNGTNGANGLNGLNGANGLGAVVVNIAPGTLGPCVTTGGAQVIGGDGVSASICNGSSGTTGQGIMLAASRSSIALTSAVTSLPVPDLTLLVPVSSTTAGTIISTEGGIQISSVTPNQYAFVDIFLFVDIPATPTSPAIVGTQIGNRRVFVANVLGQSGIANWGFSVVDVQPPGGPYTYRVVAKLPASALSGGGVIVSGSSTSTPHLRATLTAVGINR
jgi:hypothetical protein